MFDNNDYINSLFNNLSSSSSTTTEDETQKQTTYSPQTDYSQTSQSYVNPYEKDDYTSTQNFTEQQSYDSTSSNSFAEQQEQKRVSKMNAPMIQKSEETVNLVKSQSRIRLETRMKIVLSVFVVIVACLMFVTVFNFVKANNIQSTFADKQAQINLLEQSISKSKDTYTLVTDDEYLRQWAESENFVEKDETNSAVVYLDEMYKETECQDIPSNWFNDVCEFFSKLFA